MAIFWGEADQSVLSTAQELIDAYHPDLVNARIGFMFRSEMGVSQGKFVYAKTSLVSAQMKSLIEFDFLIWIYSEAWSRWDKRRRDALIDHELCHCGIAEEKDHPGTYRFYLHGHEIEEFTEIVERYGFWSADLAMNGERFKNAMQAALPGIVEVKGFVGAVPVEKMNAASGKDLLTRERVDPEGVEKDLMAAAAIIKADNGGKITISDLQSRLRIGYTKAAKIMDLLEQYQEEAK